MTDPIDKACELEEQDRERALAAQAAKPKMSFIGECYNCEAEIEWGCFCDSNCREDFQKRSKLKGIVGHE